MQIVNLYRYEDADGIAITPIQRDNNDEPYCYRLIADENKILINGTNETYCIDTHTPSEWYEITDDTIQEEINNE